MAAPSLLETAEVPPFTMRTPAGLEAQAHSAIAVKITHVDSIMIFDFVVISILANATGCGLLQVSDCSQTAGC